MNAHDVLQRRPCSQQFALGAADVDQRARYLFDRGVGAAPIAVRVRFPALILVTAHGGW